MAATLRHIKIIAADARGLHERRALSLSRQRAAGRTVDFAATLQSAANSHWRHGLHQCCAHATPTSKCISRPTTVRALLAWPLSSTAYLLRPSRLPFMRRLESRRWRPLGRPELPCKYDTCACTLSVIVAPLHRVGIAFRHSIVASIPRCHRGDPGSIPGGEAWRQGGFIFRHHQGAGLSDFWPVLSIISTAGPP